MLEIVVEGAVRDRGGEHPEGFFRGSASEVSDVVFRRVPHMLGRVVIGRIRRQVDRCDPFQCLPRLVLT